MNNTRIGELADILNRLEDAGQTGAPQYTLAKMEYEALKAAPESWSDVRSSKWNLAQAEAAVAFYEREASDDTAGMERARQRLAILRGEH
jgi:hypothetical protein